MESKSKNRRSMVTKKANRMRVNSVFFDRLIPIILIVLALIVVSIIIGTVAVITGVILV